MPRTALTYLDHSHIVLLAAAMESRPEAFERFVTFWREREFTLALSRVHLIEMRRHQDPTVRESRYRLLDELVPFQSDLGPRTERPTTLGDSEILAALSRRIIAGGATQATVEVAAFPERFADKQATQGIREWEAPSFDAILKFFHAGVVAGTEARNREPGTPYRATRASELPSAPLAPHEVEKALGDFDAALANDTTLSEIYGGADPAIAKAILAPHLARLRRMILRSGVIGPSAAFAEAIGLDVKALGNARLDAVVQKANFAQNVQRVASELATRLPANSVANASAAVCIEDCPGTALAAFLAAEIQAAEAEQDPSNAYDVDHATYYPYVDLFFADKRIAEYLRRILRRGLIPPMRNRRGPLSCPSTLEELQAALDQAISDV